MASKDAQCAVIFLSHSGARGSANPESRADNLWIPGSMLRIAPE
jgi:hypothetical protein